jgi:hypothetical protein
MEAPPQIIRRECENIQSLGGSLHRLHLLYFSLHRLHPLNYVLIVRRLLLFIPYHL